MGGVNPNEILDAPAVRVRTWEKIVLLVLVVVAIQALAHFAEFWFLGDHRKIWWLFAILSFAIFWQPMRSLVDWAVYLCARSPKTPEQPTQTGAATVDVVTTAMPGEPFEMFEVSLAALAAMRHPHRTFLLDGGNDPALQALCGKLGIEHVDCTGIGGAKAGKVNHALSTRCKGEFVLVIDPDHIAHPEFLDRALAAFEDDGVGFVQVVQAYHNLRESWVAHGAAEQTFGFYGPTLIGLHGLGIPTAIGANCLFRREALDSIGGHAVHLAEDALTSMRLHAEGWRSVYLPWRASHGLVPADLTAYFKQQTKWATGMFRLFLDELPSLWKRFPTSARIHYPLAGLFYISGLVAAISILLPIPLLFFQTYAIEMGVVEFLAHALPYLVASGFVHAWVQRWYSHGSEAGIPWRSMLLEKGTWHVYTMAFWHAIRGREVPYLPTPKTRGSQSALQWVWPHWVVIAASLAAVGWALATYHRFEEGTLLMIGFALANSMLLAPVAWTGTFPPKAGRKS